jgi:hypothetical protein
LLQVKKFLKMIEQSNNEAIIGDVP